MRIKTIALSTLLAFLITGCGPVYDKSYTYQAPSGSSAKVCVTSCNDASSYCNAQCIQSNNLCGTRKDVVDVISRLADKDKKDSNPYDSDSCKKQLKACQGSCKEEFNTCFQSCGGTVQEHKTCVAFCN